jgi:hypothetical protein
MYHTTNEYKFWKSLRDQLRGKLLLTRIESVVSVGIPDVFYAVRGGGSSGWIELKIIHGKQLRFGKEQVAWIKQHALAGTPVHILALRNSGKGHTHKTIYHWEGSQVEALKKTGTETPPRNVWPTPFDWPAIIRAISGEGKVESDHTVGRRDRSDADGRVEDPPQDHDTNRDAGTGSVSSSTDRSG